MRVVSVVIPALNEAANMPAVLASVPHERLRAEGWIAEVLVIDNGSTDGTAAVARAHGAQVIVQPVRGYGNAYKVGFANSRGDVIATGDADMTYPFGELPRLLGKLDSEQVDFISTDRLRLENKATMKLSHFAGNLSLSLAAKALFRSPFRDSQSGMWVFRRAVWDGVDVRSSGMAFSQELKHEAYFKRFRCAEEPISYGARGGEVKLNAFRDGLRNAAQIVGHRARLRQVRVVALPGDPLGGAYPIRTSVAVNAGSHGQYPLAAAD